MELRGEQVLLRVYLRSTDQYHFAPVYERVVQKAAAAKLAGATVLRGILGFGGGRVLRHSAWHVADSVPVIVEMVDTPERIAGFVEGELAEVFGGGGKGGAGAHEGIVTLERAGVMMYRKRGAGREAGARAGVDGDGGSVSGGLDLPGTIEPLSTLPALRARGIMNAVEDGLLLRVFIGESDVAEAAGGKPLYEAIVYKARELGLAGATVLRGSMGFGANSVLHTSKVLTLSTDLPVVIEVVDSEEKIKGLLPFLEGAVKEGMITMEHVRILMYKHDPADAERK